MDSMTVLLRPLVLALTLAFAGAPAISGEITPGVSIRERAHSAPINELPYFGFLPKTDAMREADAKYIGAFGGPGQPSREEGIQFSLGLAHEFIQRKDYATAAKRLNQAWLLRPDLSAVAHLFGIIVQNRFGDTAYALDLMQAATKLRDPLPTLEGDYGRTLLMAKRPAEAIPLLKAAITKQPDWATPRSNLAMAQFQTGDRAGACATAAEVRGRDLEAVRADLEGLKRRAGCR